MVSQQLIIQCDVCSVLFTYQTNLKNEERYGKTIDGVPLSFQEILSNKTNLIFISYAL